MFRKAGPLPPDSGVLPSLFSRSRSSLIVWNSPPQSCITSCGVRGECGGKGNAQDGGSRVPPRVHNTQRLPLWAALAAPRFAETTLLNTCDCALYECDALCGSRMSCAGIRHMSCSSAVGQVMTACGGIARRELATYMPQWGRQRTTFFEHKWPSARYRAPLAHRCGQPFVTT